MKRLITSMSIVFLLMLACSCRKKDIYHLEVANQGEQMLSDVTVSYDGSDFTFGTIIVNAYKELGFVSARHALPEKAVITWTTPDGVQHEKTLTVKGKIPEHFDEITVYFDIKKNNNVELSWEEDAVAKERLQSGGGVRKPGS